MAKRTREAPSRSRLARHLARQFGYSMVLVLGSTGLGTIGFHVMVRLDWVDAFLNAAMLLGGMGPIGDLNTGGEAGKLFAACFALYAGLVFLIAAALLLTPVLHHVMHRFHWENGDDRA